jgi:hypothetical protein
VSHIPHFEQQSPQSFPSTQQGASALLHFSHTQAPFALFLDLPHVAHLKASAPQHFVPSVKVVDHLRPPEQVLHFVSVVLASIGNFKKI